MGTYFRLQIKRLLRFLPGAICIVLVLLGGLLVALQTVMERVEESDENQVFRIALVGYTDDPFIEMGLAAMGALDSTRFTLHIQVMEEGEAATALAQGEISTYVVVPDGFVSAALHGETLPLKLVTTDGAAGMVSIFKAEITQTISTILLSSQRGVFGVESLFYEYGLHARLPARTDELSYKYVDYVLTRDAVYTVNELGIADALGLEGYLLCGLAVLLLLLTCLPFAPLMISADPSLGQMMAAKRRSALRQAWCDYAAFVVILTMLVLVLGVAAAVIVPGVGWGRMAAVLAQGFPVLLMAAGFSFMLYALVSDLISGVLLHFFVTLAMCFVSGCLYPVDFFPVAVQKLAAWLPTGIARSQLAGCLTGEVAVHAILALLGYSALFFVVGALARRGRIRGARR